MGGVEEPAVGTTMPSNLELKSPKVPTTAVLRPRMQAIFEQEQRLAEQQRRIEEAATKAKPGGWLPYIRAAMRQQQPSQADAQIREEEAAPSNNQINAQDNMGILPLHIQEHLAVLEQCTRNFSDALALVLSAQLGRSHADNAMKEKETGLNRRKHEDEQRHRADWANKHKLLYIFESMKGIAEEEEEERRRWIEERACKIIQRAWRSVAAARNRLARTPTGFRTNRYLQFPLPRTPEKVAGRNTRSARLKGWLTKPSSTNTGFGRSFTGDRGPNLTRSRNSRAASRVTSRRTTQADGHGVLPDHLRDAASTATLAALALATSAGGGGSSSDRQSGGFYKAMVQVAGANQASRRKRAEEAALEADKPPESSQDHQAAAAGDKAAEEVLAQGGSEDAAKEARRRAMQRVIDAYRAGAAAAVAAAAEVAAAAAAAEAEGGANAPYDPDAAYQAAMAKYFNARIPPPTYGSADSTVGGTSNSAAAAGGDRRRRGAYRGRDSEEGVSLMPDIGQGLGGWDYEGDEPEEGVLKNRKSGTMEGKSEGRSGRTKGRRAVSGKAAGAAVGEEERSLHGACMEHGHDVGSVKIGQGIPSAMRLELQPGPAGMECGQSGSKKSRMWSASAAEGMKAVDEGEAGEGGGVNGKARSKGMKRTKSLRWNVEPSELGPADGAPLRALSHPGNAAGSASSRHDSITDNSNNGDTCSLGERSIAAGSVSAAGGAPSRATSNGECSTNGSTLGTNVSVWSLHHSAHVGGGASTRPTSGGSRLGSSGPQSGPAHRKREVGAEGVDPDGVLGLSAPNSPHSPRSARNSKGSNSSRGRGLLHHSGSSSDSDMASHFSFKMREKLQALDADQTPHADQDSYRHRAPHPSSTTSSVNRSSSVPSAWAAGASPLGRSSGLAGNHEGDLRQRALSVGQHDLGGSEGLAQYEGTPAYSLVAGGGGSVFGVGVGTAGTSEKSAGSGSMAHAAAAAIAAVDEEQRLAALNETAWSGSSSGAPGSPLLGLDGQTGLLPTGAAMEGEAGGHPHLRVSTGREAWGSDEGSRASPVDCEGGGSVDAARQAAAAVTLLSSGHAHDEAAGLAKGAAGVPPLASPKLCSTLLPTKGAAPQGTSQMHTRGELESMSSSQIQRAYAVEANRASVPEMLLRAHKQQDMNSIGGSSGGSSSIRSPSSYAMAHAIQSQIDALELKYAHQQAGGGLRSEGLQGGSRQFRHSASGGSTSSGRQRSGSDTLMGLDVMQQQQQARHQQVQQRALARRASEGSSTGDRGGQEIDPALKAHAHVYARARSISYDEALEAVVARSRKGSRVNSHVNSRVNSRVCSRSSSNNKQGDSEQPENEDEQYGEEEKRETAERATAATAAAAFDANKELRGQGPESRLSSARKSRDPSKRVSFFGDGAKAKEQGGLPGSSGHSSEELALTPLPSNDPGACGGDNPNRGTPGSGGRLGSLAASLDSALKSAASAQLHREQQQHSISSSYQYRGAGRLHMGAVAAQHNRPPTPPIYGGIIHSSPNLPHHPTLEWKDEPPLQRTPPLTPPVAYSPHGTPSRIVSLPTTPPSCQHGQGGLRDSVTPPLTPSHEVHGEPAPFTPRTPPFGTKRGMPLAAIDPLAASIEARELAAARTRAWALEHAPNAVDAVAGLPSLGPETFETKTEALPHGAAQPEGDAGIGVTAQDGGFHLANVRAAHAHQVGRTAAAAAAAAAVGAEGPSREGSAAKAFQPHPPMPSTAAGSSPVPSEAAATIARSSNTHATASMVSSAVPPHTSVHAPPSGGKPHLHTQVTLRPGPASPSPPSQPTFTAVAPRQIVWMNQECSDPALSPVAAPAQKCTGGGLQWQLEYQQQHARQQQALRQPELKAGHVQKQGLRSEQQKQRQLEYQQQPRQQQLARMQCLALQQRQQQQQGGHARPQQRGSNPLHIAGLLPFMESIPVPPAYPQQQHHHSAPALKDVQAPAPLDLECVGKQAVPSNSKGQLVHSPAPHRTLSPMGERMPSPKSVSPLGSMQLMPSTGGSMDDAIFSVNPEAATPATPNSLMSGVPGAEDSSSTSSKLSQRVVEAGYLPPIDEGSAFSRYLRAKKGMGNSSAAVPE